jgi:hypothetical protein
MNICLLMNSEIITLDYFYNNSDIILKLLNGNNIAIINDRRTGKTLLSVVLLLKYYNEHNFSKKICILSKDTNIINRINNVIHYLNLNYNANIKINTNNIKLYNTLDNFLKYMHFNYDIINVGFIDEFFYYNYRQIEFKLLFFNVFEKHKNNN